MPDEEFDPDITEALVRTTDPLRQQNLLLVQLVRRLAAVRPDDPYTYRATVVRWKDADTVVLDGDLGFGFRYRPGEGFRVYGIDTPDPNPSVTGSKEASKIAAMHAERICPPGTEVKIRSIKSGAPIIAEKYGRYLPIVWLPDGRSFGDVMIAAGLAKPFFGAGPRGWSRAEIDAILEKYKT